ncbi:TetR/AcrR family transcriptional regulator [Jongsikchunia kroppenstedtii]|uniref:TetR/AcrR family transcriptional regulator n=1 Tax=Jongsikchunia kroppenstedtii TaxID=1121721 RepID=UPI0003A424B0|nr:TetR/AcrR family transcriptional regulator [Jongsikchunia kroppenstedtii]
MARSATESASTSGGSAPKPRADAQRNRAKLIGAAHTAFTETGVNAPLEKIAQSAGVGIGTLYRHFPTRADLVQAVYAQYSSELADAGEAAMRTETPDMALHKLFRLFLDTAQTKRGMKEVILAEVGQDAPVFTQARERTRAVFDQIVSAGQTDGLFRDDVSADDVHKIIAGLTMTCASDATPADLDRMATIIVDGLRVPR